MKGKVERPLGWFEVLDSMCGSDSPLSSRCLSPGLPVPANTPGHKSHWQQVIARGGLHTPARSATSQKHTGVTRATKGSGAEHNSEVGHPAWVTIHWRGGTSLKSLRAPEQSGILPKAEAGVRLGDIRQALPPIPTNARVPPYPLMQGCRHAWDGG